MKNRPLRDFLLLSWAIPLVSTALGGSLLALGLSYLDYSNHLRSEREGLQQIAPIISRRVAAEMLLKSLGTLDPVIEHLKAEYRLKTLAIIDGEKKATSSSSLVSAPIKEVQKTLLISRDTRNFSSFINLRHFLLALLPTAGLAAFGFFLQRRHLRRHFIKPVAALAETSVGGRAPDESWPLEIQQIAEKLACSFAEREQAVFGQVARGIIHDIRTHIHSIHTATQLSEMQANDAEQKLQRLERLLAACQRNVPKIKNIIDLSLDTSREIPLKPRRSDVALAVKQAVANIEEIARVKDVHISQDFSGDLFTEYDSVQLERVFTNVVKNAVEAAEDGASQRSVVIKGTRVASAVQVSVEDSGHGLRDKASAFRALKSTKPHGIGLGLFVSRKIVEAHRGKILPDDSATLGGAKFTVEIPVSEVRNEL